MAATRSSHALSHRSLTRLSQRATRKGRSHRGQDIRVISFPSSSLTSSRSSASVPMSPRLSTRDRNHPSRRLTRGGSVSGIHGPVTYRKVFSPSPASRLTPFSDIRPITHGS